MAKQTLSKAQRLRQASLFREAFAQKRSFVGRLMVLWVRSGEGAARRLGVISSRKAGSRAVDRNRARRRLREAFRALRDDLNRDADVLLIARRRLLSASHEEVRKELRCLAKKAGLFKKEPQNTEQGMSNAEGN